MAAASFSFSAFSPSRGRSETTRPLTAHTPTELPEEVRLRDAGAPPRRRNTLVS